MNNKDEIRMITSGYRNMVVNGDTVIWYTSYDIFDNSILNLKVDDRLVGQIMIHGRIVREDDKIILHENKNWMKY